MSATFNIGIHQLPSQPLIRGLGNVWPISGWVAGEIDSILNLEIEINDRRTRILEVFKVQHEIDGIDFFNTTLLPNRIHFVHFINSSDYKNHKELNISLNISTETKISNIHFSSLEITEQFPFSSENLPSKKVAICMATFNPDLRLFKNQLDSILAQTEDSWQLIINDDCSDHDIFEQIQKFTINDDRITIYRNSKNIGFYRNFEKCLSRVHFQYQYIALADQDDLWHPNKLKSLVSNINNKTLIYNDMNIVNKNGNVISPTFWNNRSNHYHNLAVLFLANTVTGSASLIKSSLLSKILPFPERLGNAFHDHWLALTAAFSGSLTYLDQVNQNYIQHQSNVTGYGQFEEANLSHSTMSLLSLQRMKASVAFDSNSRKNKTFVRNNMKVYFDAYLRRKLQYQILLTRHPYGQRETLDNIYISDSKAIKELLALHWVIYKNRWMTNNVELSYINAIEVMKKQSINFHSTIE